MMEKALIRLQAAGTDVTAFNYDGQLQRLILHDPEGNEVGVTHEPGTSGAENLSRGARLDRARQ